MHEYEILEVLGRGAFGVAHLAKRRGFLHVVKEIELADVSAGARRQAQKEAEVLGRLSHPNVVAHVTTFLEEDRLCIVMEYCDGGDLAQVLQRRRDNSNKFSEDEVLSIFSQCCLGLQHTHHKKVLHRDLKSQNIFLTTSGQVKLGDFGIAKVLDHTTAKAGTRVGTPYYVSPEVCDNQPYGFKADVWSLGVVLYELLTMQLPFQASNLVMLVLKILQSEPALVPMAFSEDLRQLCRETLSKDPDKRPSINKLLETQILREAVLTLQSKPLGHPLLRFPERADPADAVAALLDEMEITAGPVRRNSNFDAGVDATPRIAPAMASGFCGNWLLTEYPSETPRLEDASHLAHEEQKWQEMQAADALALHGPFQGALLTGLSSCQDFIASSERGLAAPDKDNWLPLRVPPTPLNCNAFVLKVEAPGALADGVSSPCIRRRSQRPRGRRCRVTKDGPLTPCASPVAISKMGLDTMSRLLTEGQSDTAGAVQVSSARPALSPQAEEDPTSPLTLAIQRGLGSGRGTRHALKVQIEEHTNSKKAFLVPNVGYGLTQPPKNQASRAFSMPRLELWPLDRWAHRPATAAQAPRSRAVQLQALFGVRREKD